MSLTINCYLSILRFRLLIVSIAVTFLITGNLYGQDSINYSSVSPTGLSVDYGTGKYSVKDEYISGEKYSGSLPYLSISWARKHNRYLYRLNLEYRNADRIKNNNVSTGITQFTLNQGFMYPLKQKSLFRKDLDLWIGPSTEFFIFSNNPVIAVDGFDYAQSYAALLSLGANLSASLTLGPKLYIESSISVTALSLGLRMVDAEEDDQSPVRLLALPKGFNSSFDLGVRYYLLSRLSVKAYYRFELCRINAWTPLVSASDNLVAGLTYSF